MDTAAVTAPDPSTQLQTATPDQTATIAPQAAAAPPAAPQAPAQPTGAAGIQAGYQPPVDGPDEQPQGPTAPTPAGTGARMLHGILNALGGTQDTTYSVDPTGKLVQSQVASGPGMQFKRIIAGATAGLAESAQAGVGPGRMGRALALGTGAGMAQTQQKTAQAKQQAQDDYTQQQKTVLQKAQGALLDAQLVKATFQNSRDQVEAGQDAVASMNTFNAALKAGAPGTKDLGVFKSMDDFMAATKADPSLMGAHARNELNMSPQYTQGDDGKWRADGVHVALIPSAWKDAYSTKDATYNHLEATTDPDNPMKMVPYTITAGTMKNGEILDKQQADEVKNQAYLKDRNDTKMKAQELAATNKSAERIEGMRAGAEEYDSRVRGQYELLAAQAKLGNTPDANGMTPTRKISAMIVNRDMDPSQLSKRAGDYKAQLADIDDYAKSVGLPSFDIAKASGDYKYATSAPVKTGMANLATLTGTATQPGVLDKLIQVSATLKQGQFPPLNDITQWAKLAAGNPKVAEYRGLLLDAQDLTAKILAGGGGGATSDAKLKAGQDLYAKGFNTQQIASTANIQKEVLGMRRDATIGDNPYLARWYGAQGVGTPEERARSQNGAPAPQQQPQQQRSQQQQAAPALVNVRLANGTPGHVSSAALAQFQKDNPGSTVVQ